MRHFFLSLIFVLTILPVPALAINKLYYPYVEQGELELEYFGSRSVDGNGAKDDAQKQQFSVGYGVTEYWFTELYAKYEKEPQDGLVFDAWEWENIFQLNERGEDWVDAGASLAYEWTPSDNQADTLEARLLFAKDLDETSHTFNIILEKDVGSGPKKALEGEVLWSSRYTALSEYFEPGFELDSSFGELEHAGSFNDQEHYIGPVAYGSIRPFQGEHGGKLKYRLGYLFGFSRAASDGQAIAQLEYEIHF